MKLILRAEAECEITVTPGTAVRFKDLVQMAEDQGVAWEITRLYESDVAREPGELPLTIAHTEERCECDMCREGREEFGDDEFAEEEEDDDEEGVEEDDSSGDHPFSSLN